MAAGCSTPGNLCYIVWGLLPEIHSQACEYLFLPLFKTKIVGTIYILSKLTFCVCVYVYILELIPYP